MIFENHIIAHEKTLIEEIESFGQNAPVHHIGDLGGKSLKVVKIVQRRPSKNSPNRAFSAMNGHTAQTKTASEEAAID